MRTSASISKATPEQRVRGLLACRGWSHETWQHTVAVLRADPATAPFVPIYLNHQPSRLAPRASRLS